MDYKQTEVMGSSWHRFSRINIDNPRPGSPVVTCTEDEVIALTEGEVIRNLGHLRFHFNLDEVFELLNPATNEPIGGSGTGADAYVLVYSYVMHEAKKRDARLAEEV